MIQSKRSSRWALLAVLVVSIFALWQLRTLRFDYDLARFFPVSDPNTAFFHAFMDRFGEDNNYVLIGFQPEKGIFDTSFLSQVDELTQKLVEHPEAERVYSPTRIRYPKRNNNPFGPRLTSSPVIHINQPERFQRDSTTLFQQKGLVRSLFSPDGKETVIQFWHHPFSDDLAAQALADTIRNWVDAMEVGRVEMAGKCFGKTTVIQTLQRETLIFTGSSILVVFFLLYWAYRRFWGVVVPLLVVGLSVLWTVGLMALTNKPFDLISNVIPTILLVIGIADAIHLVTHYQLYRKKGLDLKASLSRSVREVGAATLLTTLTTAIGFLTLTTSSFTPLIDMGLVASAGLLFALLLTYTLIPALILIKGEIFRGYSSLSGWWTRLLLGMLALVMRYRAAILLISAIIMLISPLGILQLRVNNYLLEDLRSGHPRRQAFQFFEEHFSGARGLELALIPKNPEANPFELEVLEDIATIDSFLVATFEAGSLVSPAKLIKEARQIDRGGAPIHFRLPGSQGEADRLIGELKNAEENELWESFVSESDTTWMRISGLIKDEGSAIFWERKEQLERWFDTHLQDASFEIIMTGTPYLLDLNNRFLARNVVGGLFLAIFLVGIIFAIVLKSIRLGLLSLIPNMLPLIVMAGIMGYCGIDLKISTAIIFIISFGIAVDDSIHFLTRFRREMKKHKNVSSALRHTMVSTGKAILLTTFILLSGFLTLAFSNFLGTFYLGILVAATLFMAGLLDLSLLPILLFLFYNKKKNKVR